MYSFEPEHYVKSIDTDMPTLRMLIEINAGNLVDRLAGRSKAAVMGSTMPADAAFPKPDELIDTIGGVGGTGANDGGIPHQLPDSTERDGDATLPQSTPAAQST